MLGRDYISKAQRESNKENEERWAEEERIERESTPEYQEYLQILKEREEKDET